MCNRTAGRHLWWLMAAKCLVEPQVSHKPSGNYCFFTHTWTQSEKHMTLSPCVNNIIQGLSAPAELWSSCSRVRQKAGVNLVSFVHRVSSSAILKNSTFALASSAIFLGSYEFSTYCSLHKQIYKKLFSDAYKKTCSFHISRWSPALYWNHNGLRSWFDRLGKTDGKRHECPEGVMQDCRLTGPRQCRV